MGLIISFGFDFFQTKIEKRMESKREIFFCLKERVKVKGKRA